MTTEEKARAYAESRIAGKTVRVMCMTLREKRLERFDAYDIEQAYEDGATEALASQWKDPKVELPEPDADVVAIDANGLHIAAYFNGEWYSSDDEFTRNPHAWLPIPPLKGGDE